MIHRALRDSRYNSYLKERLRKASTGPLFLTEEAAKKENPSANNAARNFEFELTVAGIFVVAGVQLDLSIDADTALLIDNRTVVLQCKRPLHEENCETNLRKAHRQLLANYAAPKDGADMRGAIAIDLTKAGGFDREVRSARYFEEIGEYHAAYFMKFAKRHADFFTHTCSGTQTVAVFHRIRSRFVSELDGSVVTATNWGVARAPGLEMRDMQTLNAMNTVFQGIAARHDPDKRLYTSLRPRGVPS